jgi:uncharacterized protein YegL
MPRLTGDDFESHRLGGGHYGYSGERMTRLELGAAEYTLVTIVQDESPSVADFKKDMEKAIMEIVKACKFSPRADNLLLRLVAFADDEREVHGFKLLETCNFDDYQDCLSPHGLTALYEATDHAVQAMGHYAKQLDANDFAANGIVFIITDGLDNRSRLSTPHTVKTSLETIVREEALESLVTVLVSVNGGGSADVDRTLRQFQADAGLTQFVSLPEANAKTLAKLAEFVSKSISAQSQSLGTGGPSVPVSLAI